MSLFRVSQELKAALTEAGVENFWTPGSTNVPLAAAFEPPCNVQWMNWAYGGSMGAFSYGVSGYYFGTHIGRYCSFGELVQSGRGNHPMNWLSTSPFQYLESFRFQVGRSFEHADEYHSYRIPPQPHSDLGGPKDTIIGNDVWIGHGAFIKMGVKIGHGAVIGAGAVVTRDVPPYAVVVGNPAVVKRYRFSEAIIEELLEISWWDYAPWDLADVDFSNIEKAINQIREKKLGSLIKPYLPKKFTIQSLVDEMESNK